MEPTLFKAGTLTTNGLATTTGASRIVNSSVFSSSERDSQQQVVSSLFKKKTVTETRKAEREFMNKTQAKFGRLVTSLNYDDAKLVNTASQFGKKDNEEQR